MANMKRTLKRVGFAVLVCAAAFALAGCEKIGIGDEGAGVPQLAEAQVAPPAIATEGVLRVGVNGANAPFSTVLGEKLVGIDVDIAAALGDELGVKVEVVDVGSEPETALTAGTVDVIMGVDTADTTATCWKSSPYIDTAVGLFSTSSGAIMPTADSKPLIEAQESSMSAWEVTNQFGESALKSVSDLRTAFEDLENGNVTYVASDAIIGSYVTHTAGGRAILIGLMQTPGGYCVGVEESNSTLRSAVAAAVASLVEKGTSDIIEAKWIGSALSLGSLSYTNFSASSADSEKDDERSSSSSVGKVGSNAVDLKDSGTTNGGSAAPANTESTWSGTETATQNAPTGGGETYVAPEPTYVEPDPNTYYDPNAVQPQETYVDPGAGQGGGEYYDPNAGLGDLSGAGTYDAGAGDAGAYTGTVDGAAA